MQEQQKQIVVFVPGGGGVERLIVPYALYGQNAIYLFSGAKGEIEEFVDWCNKKDILIVSLNKISSKDLVNGSVYCVENLYAFDTTSNIEDWCKILSALGLGESVWKKQIVVSYFISTASGHFSRFKTCWRWCTENLGLPYVKSLGHIKAGKDTSFEWVLGLAYRIPGFIAWARENRRRHCERKGQLS